MRYQLNILNTASIIFIAGCVIYTISKYDTLSTNEGWGVIAIIGLTIVAFTAILIEWMLQLFVKNRTVLNAIELCVLLILGLLIYLG